MEKLNKVFCFVLGWLMITGASLMAQTAEVQVIHNSADPAAEFVDVYVNGDLAIDDFGFRTATPFLELPSGVELNLGIAPGNSISSDDILANFPVTLDEDQKYVVMATGVLSPDDFNTATNGDDIAFTLQILAPAQTAGTSADNVDLAVYHGSTDAPAVDVLTGGTILIDDLSYGNFTDGYLSVPAADYILDVTPGNANDVVVASFEANISSLGGGAAVVFASGFLDPTTNQDGAAFGLFAALADGTVIELPQVVEETDPAMVQVIHNAADTAAEFVDVYINGELAIDDFEFRTATPFIELPSEVELNLGIAPGNSGSADDVIANFPVTLAEGEKYVVTATGVLEPAEFDSSVNGDAIAFTLAILTPAQTEGTSAGNVDLAVFHGSTDAPAVDVLTAGTVLIDDLSYGNYTNGYLSVPAADYILDVTPGDANDVIVASFEANISSLGGGAAIVFASGFLDPMANGDGAAFGLFAALPDGTVIELPVVVPDPDPAMVQVIHNAADPAAEFVDVYINGELAIDDFEFRTATPFIELPSEVELNLGIAPGNSGSADDVIANFPVTLAEGEKYVVTATGVLDPSSFDSGANGDAIAFTLAILTPAQTEGTSADNVDLAVFHGSTDAPTVDVLTGGNILIDDLSYGNYTAGYLSVPAADYILDVTPGNANDVVVASFEANISSLGGGAAIVFASGFLDPSANQDGAAFGLFAALADGTVIELPVVVPDPDPAMVQVIHNAADPAAEFVDVYINGELAIDDFEFRTATPFIELPSEVELNLGIAPGNSGSADDVIANFPVTLAEGEKYVVTATGVLDPSSFDSGANGDAIAFTLAILTPAQTEGTSADNVDLAVFHGSTDAPTVDVLTGGTILIDDLSYGDYTDGYLSVPAADYILDVTPGNANDVVVASFEANISSLGGGAAVVFASGFLDPSANQDGAAFGLFAALADGTVIELPVVVPVPDPALVQVVHNAADPAAEFVDVYINGELAIDDFEFRTATPFIELPSGVELNLGIAPGNSGSADDVIANFPVTLEEGEKYVVAATGVLDPSSFDSGTNGDAIAFTLAILTPAQTEGVSADNVDIAVFHGSPDAPTVDVLTGGTILVDDLSYGNFTDGYLSVPAADYILDITPGNANDVIVASFQAPLTDLGGGAAVVFASGFLDPSANQDGAAFGLLAVLADGTAILLPQVIEEEPKIVSFTLIDAETDEPVEGYDPIEDGAVIPADMVASGSFNVRANLADGETVGSVNFVVTDENGKVRERTESAAPYAAFGDNKGDYRAIEVHPGDEWNIVATPFTEKKGNGDELAASEINFSFTDPSPSAMVQVVHNSPDPAAEEVDIYLNGELAIDDFAFRTATPFISLPAGVELEIGVAAGNSSSADDIIATFPVTLEDGEKYIVVATGVLDPSAFDSSVNGDDIAFTLQILTPARTGSGDNDEVALAVYHGSTDAPAVDVLTAGTILVDDITYGNFTDGYLSVPAAKYILDVTPGGDNDNVLVSYEADISGLGGGAGLVFASGFLAPDANQEGAGFGLFVVLPDGTVIELPVAEDGGDEEPCENGILSLSLVNADTDEVIDGFEAIEDGAEIDLSELPTDQLAIVANICEEAKVASVYFELSGDGEFTRLENLAPFTLFGDKNGNVHPWVPKPPKAGETYKVEATSFSGKNKGGDETGSITIEFTFTGESSDDDDDNGDDDSADDGDDTADDGDDDDGDDDDGDDDDGDDDDGDDDDGDDDDGDDDDGDDDDGGEADGLAQVQVIHNAADPAAQEVDIYINGDLAIDDFEFRTATPFLDLPSGVELTIGVAGGNSNSADDILASFPVTLENDEKYVVMATGVLDPSNFDTDVNGNGIGFTLKILTPARTMSENNNHVDIAVFHGVTDVPAIDILTGGTRLVDDLGYGEFTDGYFSVPAGEYILDVTQAHDNGTIVRSFIAPLDNQGGKSIVVFATGFLDPSENQNGENFNVFVAFADGGVIGLPVLIGGNAVEDENPVSLYPNPVTNGQLQVVVEKGQTEQTEILLRDMNGRIQLRTMLEGVNRKQLDLQDLGEGMYLLQVIGETYQESRAVIIQK